MPLRFAGGVRTWGWICCSCWRSCCLAARRRSRRPTAKPMTSGREAALGARLPTGRWCAATWSSIRCYPRTPSPTGPSHCEYSPPSPQGCKGENTQHIWKLNSQMGFVLIYLHFTCKEKLNPSWFTRYTCLLKSATRLILHWVVTVSTNSQFARVLCQYFPFKRCMFTTEPYVKHPDIPSLLDVCGNDKISCLAEEPLNPGKVPPYPILWPPGPHLSVHWMNWFFPRKVGSVFWFSFRCKHYSDKHTMSTNITGLESLYRCKNVPLTPLSPSNIVVLFWKSIRTLHVPWQ